MWTACSTPAMHCWSSPAFSRRLNRRSVRNPGPSARGVRHFAANSANECPRPVGSGRKDVLAERGFQLGRLFLVSIEHAIQARGQGLLPTVAPPDLAQQERLD